MPRYLLLAALAAASPAALAATFISIDLPGSLLSALSENGCVAAGGVLGGKPAGFRWTAASGVEPLKNAIAVHGLSSSGAFVAGSTLDGMQREVAGYWDAAGALHPIAAMPGLETVGSISQAHAISDEPRIVGSARRPGGTRIAYEWTAADGMHALPFAGRGREFRAIAISDDGHRIAGWGRNGDQLQPLGWSDGRPLPMTTAGDTGTGEILGGSRDAEALVGWLGDSNAGAAAVYLESGIQRLAAPATVVRLQASSNDGKVLVGDSGAGEDRTPWVWLEREGFVTLADLLARRHARIPRDWRPLALTAVSADGRRLGGWGKHGSDRLDSFIVDLDGDDTGCGASARRPLAASARP